MNDGRTFVFLGAGGADSDSPPTTVVYELDAEGRVVERTAGEHSEDELAAFVDAARRG